MVSFRYNVYTRQEEERLRTIKRKMKLLGYIDDAITWFFNWQSGIGIWNLIVMPIEIIIIYYICIIFRIYGPVFEK